MVVFLNTFLFADLCDYTEHTFRQGDEFAAELAVGFHLLVRELAATESCEVVKAIGDAVMVRAAQVEDAVRLAQRIHESGRQLGYPAVRVGIDTGPAVARDGDWYGTTVNRAARVAEAANPGEMLLTEGALAALTPSLDVRIVERGVRALKGLPESLLHTAYAGGPDDGGHVGAAKRRGERVAPGWRGGGRDTALLGGGLASRPWRPPDGALRNPRPRRPAHDQSVRSSKSPSARG
jgi:Adenylate and Guanylate cyclase catalytic domain